MIHVLCHTYVTLCRNELWHMYDVAVNELYHTHHGDFDESYRTSHTDDVGLMSHGTRIILLSMSHGTHTARPYESCKNI